MMAINVEAPLMVPKEGTPHPSPTKRSLSIMKIGIVSFLVLLCAAALKLDQYLVPGLSASFNQKVNGEIPGGSPIETCLDDDPQLLDIELVEIDPNPPVPGANLTISAKGTLAVDLVDGSYVDVLVRYGFITLVNRRYDLCELLPEVDLECPVKAGFLSLSRVVEIPEDVPPGTYMVDAKAYTPGDELLTCLTATVTIDV